MSLINQMLQDLDTRRAAHGVGSARLPNDVRPLPAQPRSSLPIILGASLLIVLAAGVTFYWMEMRQEGGRFIPVTSVPDRSSSASVKEIQAAAPITEPEPPSSVTLALPEIESSLRMADVIREGAGKKSGVKPAVTTGIPEKLASAEKSVGVESRGRTAKTEVSAPVVSPQTVLKPGKEPMIEKTESVGSPRERAEAEYRKAIAAVNQGRVAEALDGLRNTLRQDGYHVAARQLSVKLLLEAKRLDEAMQVLQEGLQSQPAQIGWATSLARLQVERGDLAGAWQTLNYSLPAATGNADYQGFSAHVLQRMGRSKEAADHYLAAARLAPGDGRWWLGLGLAMESEGRSSEARDAFLRARQSGNLSADLMALIEQKLR